MSDKNPFKRTLWTDRSVEETVEMYTDWADSYEADVSGRGYCTPFRMAEALKSFKDEVSGPILDLVAALAIPALLWFQLAFMNSMEPISHRKC